MELTIEQRELLVRELARAEHEACCSDKAAGIMVGAMLALGLLGYQNLPWLSRAIVAESNRLYCEAQNLAECSKCYQLVPAETSRVEGDATVCELC